MCREKEECSFNIDKLLDDIEYAKSVDNIHDSINYHWFDINVQLEILHHCTHCEKMGQQLGISRMEYMYRLRYGEIYDDEYPWLYQIASKRTVTDDISDFT